MMLRRLQSLRVRMLVSFLLAVLVMMLANSLITQKLTREALTRDLRSSLEVISAIAADAVAVGLEFQDADAVSSAVESFKKQALFSYISVQDKGGNEVYTYRKPGFEDLTNLDRLAEGVSGDEMFQKAAVLSDSSQVGTITIGISLQGRNRVLRSAQFAQMWLTAAVIVLFVVITVIIANLISRPVRTITRIAQHLAEGDLDQEVSIHRRDEIGALADSFRHMIAAQREKAELAEQIARGNLDVKAEAICEKDVLGHAMVTMKASLATMLMELQKTIQAQKEGDLEARCHPEKLHGAYADLLRGVNESLDAVINPIYEGIEVMQEYASGNLEREMRKLPGKQIVLTEGLNEIRNNLKALIEEGAALATAASNGDLQKRGDASKFEGGYRRIIEGMNRTIENILLPVHEAASVLRKMSDGDLSVYFEGEYKGDHAIMKEAVNTTLESLNQALGQVSIAAEQVAANAQKLSDSSQSLSDGAAKQASSLEQITASMSELGSQTKLNAENASAANQLSVTARENAAEGNKQMKKMVSAMEAIKKSSDEISRIIKAIDEIAFQTNLLALNAAVEAARAGVHGKGFAVVAEEVRNLAQRSAKAAQETTELIEDAVQKVDNGTKIASTTAKALDRIVDSIAQVSELVGEIANASNEQALGIEQVNSGLGQIEQVTQANTANAEESASVSRELSDQATRLKLALSRFWLRERGGDPRRSLRPEPVTVVRESSAGTEWQENLERADDDPPDSKGFVALDDDEFDKF